MGNLELVNYVNSLLKSGIFSRKYLYRDHRCYYCVSYLLSTDGISLFIGIPSVETR